ncbi:MAG: MerR family transcriptional regulator [Coprococcus sp.]
MELMTLKEICESVGVSRRSIQCYEKAGLMKYTGKNKYGYLLYDEETLARAKRIRFMQELGFKLREIKEIIDAPRNVMKEALERRVKELEKETARLDQIIKEAIEYMETLG